MVRILVYCLNRLVDCPVSIANIHNTAYDDRRFYSHHQFSENLTVKRSPVVTFLTFTGWHQGICHKKI